MKNKRILCRSRFVFLFVFAALPAGWLGLQALIAARTHAAVAAPAAALQPGAPGQLPRHPLNQGNPEALFNAPASPLAAAPTYAWHTFYGSSNTYENIQGVAVDGSGNIYVVGFSGAGWQGDGSTAPLHPYSGGDDLFVMKLDHNGLYQWHTFYGSAQRDSAQSVTADADGVYVAGFSASPGWQGDGNVNPLHPHSGADDIMLVKLNGSGAYQWHAFYGSTSGDGAYSVSLDGSGNLYLAGVSSASWLGDGSANPIHSHSAGSNSDVTVMKLSRNGAYQWHTFYGSAYDDRGQALALDSAGGLYVSGSSEYTWLGDGNANPLHTHSPGYGYNLLAMKLSSQGVYQWHTFYGTSGGMSRAYGLAVEPSGLVYAAGTGNITWQGDGNANPLHAHSGGFDMLVLSLTSQGAYRWHTFYGSANYEACWTVAVDAIGRVYAAGGSESTWQGDGDAGPLHAHGGGVDVTLLGLTSQGAYRWHTFYGSASQDEAIGMVIDRSGIILGGDSYATWQGDGSTDPLHANSGGGRADTLVMKLLSPIYTVYLPLLKH